MAMMAEAPESPVTEGVRSLEVRWIFRGQLEAAVAGWFGRFPAGTESRADTYLLDPQLGGLSLKVRGGGALEGKGYRGGPGIVEGAGPARGRGGAGGGGGEGEVGVWRGAAQARQRGPGRLEAGTQEAARQPVPTGQRADCGAHLGAGPGAAVRVGTHRGPRPRPGLVDRGLRGDRPHRSAPARTRGHRRACVRPGVARWCETRPR